MFLLDDAPILQYHKDLVDGWQPRFEWSHLPKWVCICVFVSEGERRGTHALAVAVLGYESRLKKAAAGAYRVLAF
jgi:hypothetical protein